VSRCWVSPTHQAERALTLYVYGGLAYVGTMYFTLKQVVLARHITSVPIPHNITTAIATLRSISLSVLLVLLLWYGRAR
jgi:hypothetical protein